MDVDSTAIQAIDYDQDHEKLFVRFASGERYLYVGVPGEVCRSFLDADSKGRFFQAEIRDQYPYNRLEG
jgi:lysyl-tRNA synthetase class 2